MKILASIAIAIAASVTGCATHQAPIWVKSGATQSEFARDSARCDYETSSATQGTDTSMRSIFGQELDRAIRKNDLMKRCLMAHGYTQQ